ncbi:MULTISPECIES: riboflavin synthase [unclassified Brevibacterium]|uniref:riboflavin synthase n=1 Tax=unclassified Brevibacterium TaxID=2614124 RepID=UPI001092E6A5|nr:riboflavin synthase [Brevibacterium sp. S22]TGD29645.1 riboflavin synthase [Brevibacterium sp. S22]
MFTGIIEGLGTVESIEHTNDSAAITIDAGQLVADLDLGGSLAVNGVCLTSTRRPAAQRPGLFTAEVMGETLRLTGLGTLATGDRVNLERCTPASGRFDGHVVQGHVDGRGELLDRIDRPDWSTLRIGIPSELAPLTAVKGSIALNGVSLTLTAVSEPSDSSAWVEVGLIPATLTHTTFGELPVGAAVNIEVDVLAKYTARLLSFRTSDRNVAAASDAVPTDSSPTSAGSSFPNSTQQGVDHD